MPTWANNPEYTLHATSTKPDEQHHKPVFEIFANTNQKKSSDTTTTSNTTATTPDNNNNKKPNNQNEKNNDPMTRF